MACLMFVMVFMNVGSLYAQDHHSGRVIDMNSPLSNDINVLINQHQPYMDLQDLQTITRDIQLSAADYSIEPGLMLALMVGEQVYPGNPQTRLYYFNLDMGSLADQAVFPEAWYDSQRVARSYVVQFERYNSLPSAVAAYFVGSQTIPSDGDISGLSDGLKDLVNDVLTNTAEWSHLGERSGPQVVEPTEFTPESSFEHTSYDMSDIEAAYIDNMVHFNRNLDPETAREIFDAIHLHASEYQTVDARLVMALVATESSFRPDAVSHAGAQGLGQLMPFTSDRFGVEDPFDIDENIRATFAYLAREIERWDGHDYQLDRILASYNAGAGAVERYSDSPHFGIPPYNETQNYVRIVVNRYFFFLPEDERPIRIGGGQSRYYEQLSEFDES